MRTQILGLRPIEVKTAGAPARKPAERLSVPLQVKAESADDDARTFQGLASTWSLDLGNDVIHPGAYARTLSHWKTSGRVIPLLDSHASWDSVNRVVGKMTAGEETSEGLLCTFEMLAKGDPVSDAAWSRVKGGLVTGLSIGYRPVRFDYEQPEGTSSYWDKIRHLHEVELREVSLVVFGMNPGALIDTDSAKSLASLAEAIRTGALSDEQKQELRALLDAPPAPADGPPADPQKGLAPEQQTALNQRILSLKLGRLTGSARTAASA